MMKLQSFAKCCYKESACLAKLIKSYKFFIDVIFSLIFYKPRMISYSLIEL